VHREDVEYLINVFHDAKEYGSILDVKPIDFDAIERRLEEIRNGGTQDLFEFQYRNIILAKIPALVKQARIISQKYDVVCTNPPYMGRNGMNGKLSDFLRENFPDSKSDLFASFIEKGFKYLKINGFNSMVTMQSWMFLSSFEELRKKIIDNYCILTLLHMDNMVMGIAFGTAATVMMNYHLNYKGRYLYVTLKDISEKGEPHSFPVINDKLTVSNTDNYKVIPGMPIAYWVSDRVIDCFNMGKPLREIAEPKVGLQTGDNDKFVRIWYEVPIYNIGFNYSNCEKAAESGLRWFPYNKGGDYRKWYGNNKYVVKWENDGIEIKNFKDKNGKLRSRPQNTQFYFKKGITWSFVSSSYFGVRYLDQGFIFDVAGSSVFPPVKYHLFLTGLLCSKISTLLMKALNPTLNYQVGNVASLPVILPSDNVISKINLIVNENINLSCVDWDSFETSWDFQKHPLIIYSSDNNTIEQAFNNWTAFTEKQFNQLKSNEEELNRIFINIYGLQDELTPEVEEKNVTITRIYNSKEDIPESIKGNNYALTREDVIKSFISYAVGCMFGRYSIDAEGLIYAGGDFKDKWKCENGQWKVRKIVKDDDGKVIEDTWVDATFVPDMDNVLPITDDEYFEDDIVSRFIEFLKVTFGEDTLEENLDYIADTLGRKSSETARQAIRRYFLKDFYKDHVQVYQKRPIYWLFDSGKQDGFKALIYMHRYDEFTVARVRTDYLHKLQKSYEAEIKRLDIIIDSNVSQREKTNARKKKEKILKQMEECLQYDQVIAHVANQRIKIDLDDGVSVNYSKFQGIEVPQGEGRKPLKADLLAKI
jgi:hypothetical protein